MTNGPVFFTVAAAVRNIFTMGAGLVLLRWIGPKEFGVWQILLLSQTYLAVIRLGIVNGMNRELSFLAGKGAMDEALGLASTTQAYVLACCLLGCLTASLALVIGWPAGSSWRFGLMAMIFIIPSDFYYSYLEGTFRTSFDFRGLAWIYLGAALASVMTIPIVYWWGFPGYCLRAIILSLGIMATCHAFRPIRIGPKFNKERFLELLKTGLPLYFQNYIGQVAGSLDRLIILAISDVRTLGLYGPSVTLSHAMTLLSDSLSSYLSPKLAFLFGQSGRKESLYKPTMEAMLLGFLFAAPCLFIGWLAVPFLVESFFPQYKPGIFAMRLGLIAGFFMTSRIGMSAPCMMKAWNYVFSGVLLLFIAKSVFPWFGASIFGALNGVAAGNAVAAFVVALGTIVIINLCTRGSDA